MSSPRLTPTVRAALPAALAVLVYLNTLPNAFVIDDRFVVLDNWFLRAPDGLWRIWTTDVWAFFVGEAASSYYRPLMHTALYFVWPLSKSSPVGYHALNIALHAAVTTLLFLFLSRLYSGTANSGLRFAHSKLPLWSALLFAAHPVHTEAVAWISALPDLQSSVFFLLGFLLHLCALESRGWRRYLQETAVAACVLLALLAKEIGIVLPVMLALYAATPAVHAAGPTARRRGPGIYGWAAICAAIALYLLMRRAALGTLAPPLSSALPFPRMMAGWFALLAEYTWRIVWPARLSAFHVMPPPGGLIEGRVLAGIAIAAALGVLTAALYRRGRPEWLAPPLFVLALAPSFLAPLRENGFWMGERYLYLASVGFCWIVARSAEWKKPAAALLAVLLVGYSGRTALRNAEWRDEIGFYLHELRTEGESPQLRPLLVEAYVRRGMPREAREHALAMVRLAPRDPVAHNSLGFVAGQSGDTAQALVEYRRAAELARERGNPAFAARALNNLAVARSQSGEREAALADYREALRLDPNFADGHNNLGAALLEIGKPAEAVGHFRRALAINPAFVAAHANLGHALALTGDTGGARRSFERALALDPQYVPAQAGLGSLSQPPPLSRP